MSLTLCSLLAREVHTENNKDGRSTIITGVGRYYPHVLDLTMCNVPTHLNICCSHISMIYGIRPPGIALFHYRLKKKRRMKASSQSNSGCVYAFIQPRQRLMFGASDFMEFVSWLTQVI
ncbi:hypothetical protein FPSE_04320 [Fusarium pseudograminearum CS3096]|uniref:Uncharacterized protein n=1 Tax=Fusarium pseudograminearum (strain CS3096) TaxID=1028729 RepID=K3W1A2_FUSPC|nr:hypothetical protein FPSE_04320 [Fusarium pseudograminearum CS3096]EKJ75545.1 hypothetical protein FPSE_04320 [Fusarium pseudograminearum CS3096]